MNLFSLINSLLQGTHPRDFVDKAGVYSVRSPGINGPAHRAGETHQPCLGWKAADDRLRVDVDAHAVVPNKGVDVGMLQHHILELI